ncbi:Modification methylase HphIA [Ophiocordyceps camponoti-floridani]|uniref:DNA (cytosine-5-)-methyltransferase n=1 Tax=Ophiocordyceps camponoti-floridani TaxID=2030778 RepID=A0A8H4VBN5_9HYPO|nr:Modification methylase HphIA [Ophiocordyceps camponoti-floridani]
MIDLTEEAADTLEPIAIDLTVTDARNLPVGYLVINKVLIQGTCYEKGDFVEVMHTTLGSQAVDFIRLEFIAENSHRQRLLRGVPYTRTRQLKGEMQMKLNEVCLLYYIDQSAESKDPVLVGVDENLVVRKRHLIVTNAPKPDHNPASTSQGGKRHQIKRHGPLVCRWTKKLYFTMRGRTMKINEVAFARMRSSDCSHVGYRVQESKLRGEWRGSQPVRQAPNPFHKYTLFDAFCGAGGVSRGADMAGFDVVHAMDKNDRACETYRLNFPGTKLHQMTVHDFIVSAGHIRTDVLHLSPPCQPFSPAHTHESIHDDENMDAFLGSCQLIDKIRPRMVTLEETFGIGFDRHRNYLRAVISHLTYRGYSVRWRPRFRLCTWGCAQDRERLVMIAAGPGEELPYFPKASHSETGGGGTKPFTSFGQAIAGISSRDDHHNIRALGTFPMPRMPLDASRLVKTITTSSSELYHPSGRRVLSVRELACLQGFPHHHRFVGTRTDIRRQIGNAFPPNTVKVLYRHLKKCLMREDGLLPMAGGVEDYEGVIRIEDDLPVTGRLVIDLT